MQSIKVTAAFMSQYLPSMWIHRLCFCCISTPAERPLIYFYFLYSHHLTAFLGLTLLILGIASLLASVVVLCYRPKLVWNSFIPVVSLSSHSFPAVRCLHCFPAVWRWWSSEMLSVDASSSDRSMLMFCIFTFILIKLQAQKFSRPDHC